MPKRDARQAEMLGPFNKAKLPVVPHDGTFMFDLTLLPALQPTGVRPAAELLDRALRGQFSHHLFTAVSGSGKTSALKDLAKRHFLVYMLCSGNRPLSAKLRISWRSDQGFVRMVEAFTKSLPERTSVEDAALEAKRAATVEVMVRLAQLRALLKADPNLTPEGFFMHQMLSEDTWLIDICESLMNVKMVAATKVVEWMRNELEAVLQRHNSKLVIAVDEIEVGAAAAADHLTNREANAGSSGFLYPLMSALKSLGKGGRFHVIYTGTGSPQKRAGTKDDALRGSTVDNRSTLERVASRATEDYMPTVSADACRRFFSELLDVSDTGLDVARIGNEFEAAYNAEESLDDLMDQPGTPDELLRLVNRFFVGGRHRLLTRVVSELSVAVQKEPVIKETKPLVLWTALCGAVRAIRDDLVTNFEKWTGAGNVENEAQANELRRYLVSIWTATVLDAGRARFPHDERKVQEDLTQVSASVGCNGAGERN